MRRREFSAAVAVVALAAGAWLLADTPDAGVCEQEPPMGGLLLPPDC